VKGFVFVGTSLDGFIARPNGAFDFLDGNEKVEGGEGDVDWDAHGYKAFFDSIDALLMGRKTYETALGFGSWPYGKKPVFVLSSRPIAPAPEGAVVEQLSGEPAEIAAQLDKRGLHNVYVDGGDTVQRFLRAGQIHHMTITRVPVLIGSGISLFGRLDHDVRVKHVRTRDLGAGYVQSEYDVVESSAK
jgi:dihydrofolate reductase